MSRSSKLSRSASVKSDLTGTISIAAFMGSCLPPLLSVTHGEILTGHDLTDADQFPAMSAATGGRGCRRAALSAAIGSGEGLARVRHGWRKPIRPKKASDVEWVSLESIDSDRAAGLSGVSP